MQENNVDVIFDAISENESFARVVAAAFVTRLDPVSYTHLDVYKRQAIYLSGRISSL